VQDQAETETQAHSKHIKGFALEMLDNGISNFDRTMGYQKIEIQVYDIHMNKILK
jgi:hypothetical protein